MPLLSIILHFPLPRVPMSCCVLCAVCCVRCAVCLLLSAVRCLVLDVCCMLCFVMLTKAQTTSTAHIRHDSTSQITRLYICCVLLVLLSTPYQHSSNARQQHSPCVRFISLVCVGRCAGRGWWVQVVESESWASPCGKPIPSKFILIFVRASSLSSPMTTTRPFREHITHLCVHVFARFRCTHVHSFPPQLHTLDHPPRW
jgi:hypothetical protein